MANFITQKVEDLLHNTSDFKKVKEDTYEKFNELKSIENVGDLEIFKNYVLLQIGEVEHEFKLLIDEIKKIKESKKNPLSITSILRDFKNDDFYFERKEKKFALIIVELYALVEQAMQNLHALVNEIKLDARNRKGNTISLIEEAVSSKITIETTIYPLAILRNSVLHELLDIELGKNDAKEKVSSNKHLHVDIRREYQEIFSKKPKKIIGRMIQDSRVYISGIGFKEV